MFASIQFLFCLKGLLEPELSLFPNVLYPFASVSTLAFIYWPAPNMQTPYANRALKCKQKFLVEFCFMENKKHTHIRKHPFEARLKHKNSVKTYAERWIQAWGPDGFYRNHNLHGYKSPTNFCSKSGYLFSLCLSSYSLSFFNLTEHHFATHNASVPR